MFPIGMARLCPNLNMALKIWDIHPVTVDKSIELNMCEPVSAYTPLVLPAIISQLCVSTTSLLIPCTVAVSPLLVVVLPSFHLHQYNHSNTVVICSN